MIQFLFFSPVVAVDGRGCCRELGNVMVEEVRGGLGLLGGAEAAEGERRRRSLPVTLELWSVFGWYGEAFLRTSTSR